MASKITSTEPIPLQSSRPVEPQLLPLPPLQMVPSTQICESLQPISPLGRKKWIRNRFLFRVAPIVMPVSYGSFGSATFGLSSVKNRANGPIEEIPRSVFGGDGIHMRHLEVADDLSKVRRRSVVGYYVMPRAKSLAMKVNIEQHIDYYYICMQVNLHLQLLFAATCVYTTQRAHVWGSSEETSELFAHFFQTELTPFDCFRVRYY